MGIRKSRKLRRVRDTPTLSFPSSPHTPRNRYSVASRWGGHECLLSDGFVPVVTSFLKYGCQLKPFSLRPAEALFVLQLMSYKRDAKAPFPGYKTIAQRMGISVKYARKLAHDLESKSLIRRVVRVGTTNRFDLSPLFAALAAHVSSLKASKQQEIA